MDGKKHEKGKFKPTKDRVRVASVMRGVGVGAFQPTKGRNLTNTNKSV